jgi:hypothetical protein
MTHDFSNWGGSPRISRRLALGAGLALGAAAALPPTLAAAGVLDPTRPEDARAIYRKMRYRTDSGLVFAWVKGPHLAVVGANLTPMYGINLGAIQRITQRPDGGFDVREIEISFTTDVDTGRRLTEFRNPFTGEVLPVKVRTPRPSTVSYSRDNDLRAPPTYQGAKFDVSHYPVSTFVIGDELFVRDRTRATLQAAGQPERILNEISTFSAPRAVVLDPTVASVDAKVQSNDMTSWPTWLKMAGAPGVMGLYAVGGKARDFSSLPADWLEMVHEVWPEIAADPIAALDRPLES